MGRRSLKTTQCEQECFCGRRGALWSFRGQWHPSPPAPQSYIVRVRHEVADVAVLLTAERTDSTCCSASSILPG
jgi:hypothetical protein